MGDIRHVVDIPFDSRGAHSFVPVGENIKRVPGQGREAITLDPIAAPSTHNASRHESHESRSVPVTNTNYYLSLHHHGESELPATTRCAALDR